MSRIRVLIVSAIGAGALALGLGASPAFATTQQQMIRIPAGAAIDIGPAAPCAPGDIVITAGNGHDHFFTNPNGDFWENATIEGTASLVDPATGVTLEQGGHGEAWFGIESNNGAMVFHFKDSVQLPSGRIQQNGQFVLNANGVPVVTRVTASCS